MRKDSKFDGLAIIGFEVREAADAAKQYKLTVAGHYVVDVYVVSGCGDGFIWVAKDEKEAAELRELIGYISKLLLEA